MAQQSQKQKDGDASAENKKENETVPGKPETPGFNTPDSSHIEFGTNLNPRMEVAQPEVGQTTQDDEAAGKEESPSYENGIVDAPAGRDPTEAQADAKREVSPNLKSKLAEADQSSD